MSRVELDARARLFSGALALVCLLTFAWTLEPAFKAAQSRAWPTARATVEAVELVRSSRSVRDRLSLRYAYEVNGASLSSNRYWWGENPSDASARRLAEALPVGSALSVRYNPSNPAEAVVEPRNGLSIVLNLLPLGAGLAFLYPAVFLGPRKRVRPGPRRVARR